MHKVLWDFEGLRMLLLCSPPLNLRAEAYVLSYVPYAKCINKKIGCAIFEPR